MYSILKNIHSYWAYLVLLVLILCIFNAITGKINGKDFLNREILDCPCYCPSFGLIFSHLQLLIGLILYFVSPWFDQWSNLGMGGVMKDAQARLFLVEHPFTNILAIALITIGWSAHKHQSDPSKKISANCIILRIRAVVVNEQNSLG